MVRLTLLRTLALLFTLALWFAALGLVDLVTPWFLDERTAVHDLGYGAVTGLLAPAGLLAQVRNPEHWVAGLQQVGACALAYLVAGAIADPAFLVLGALVAGGLVLLLVVHPVGGMFFAVPEGVSPPLLGLALLGAGPFLLYALDTAEKQRDGLAPVDFHTGLGSWAGLTAMGIAIPLVALLAAIRPVGWRLPLRSAAAAAALWGAACLVYPDEAGSEGRVWGALAIAWAAALVVAAKR